jgi:hypothetical protein
MLSLILAAAVASVPAEPGAPAAAREPAQATVIILRAVEFRVDRLAATEESVLRRTSVRERDGSVRTATLVEFY